MNVTNYVFYEVFDQGSVPNEETNDSNQDQD